MTTKFQRTGGQILVDQLKIQGVEVVTCVPGESYLAALDALYDHNIKVLICRHEGGAAMMAEAHAKLTNRPGVCFVTRGPGATNAAHGVHIAHHDSSPMILFVGQVERSFRGRGAFQELDYVQAFQGIAKWVVEIDDPKRIPEVVARAFAVATQGRAGPVVVSLPEDILTEMVEVADAAPVGFVQVGPSDINIQRFKERLSAAKAPIIIAGGGCWDDAGINHLADFAADWKIPVVAEFRRTTLMHPHHPCFAGDLGFGPNPKLVEAIKDSDLIILLGARLSEVPSQSYTLIDLPKPSQGLIHIFPDASELGRVYQADLGIIAHPCAFSQAMKGVHATATPWAKRTETLHQNYLAWSSNPAPIVGDFQYGEVITQLRDMLPDDTIVTNGAGNYAIWVHRFWHYLAPKTQVAPTSGSVGYSVPAGVMAQYLNPTKTVLTFAGDGCFLMNGNEFATAVQYNLPLIVMVIDNGMYGTIRMHQEKNYPHRVIGTDLKNPDFAALARAMGGHGETVRTTAEFMPAFERAKASKKPAIIHCFIHPEAITPAKTMSQISAGV